MSMVLLFNQSTYISSFIFLLSLRTTHLFLVNIHFHYTPHKINTVSFIHHHILFYVFHSHVYSKVIKDVTDFIKKRAQLEAEYAKNLKDLCKAVPGTGVFSKPAIDKELKYVHIQLLFISIMKKK